MTNFGKWKSQKDGNQGNAPEEQKTLRQEDGPVTSILMSREGEVGQELNFWLRHLHIG